MEFRRFIIKDESNRNRLESLIEEKSLSREDLILILSTMGLNPNIFPQEHPE